MSAPSPGAAQTLAVHSHDIGRLLAQAIDPSREAAGEQSRIERVHHVVERLVRGNAAFEGKHRAQEGQLFATPAPDLDEVLRGREGGT